MRQEVNADYFRNSRLSGEAEGLEYNASGLLVYEPDPNPDPAQANPAGVVKRNGGLIARRRITVYAGDTMMRFVSPGRMPPGSAPVDMLNSPWWIELDRMMALIDRARTANVDLIEMARRQLALPDVFTDANLIVAVRPKPGIIIGCWAGPGLTATGPGERRIIAHEAPHLYLDQLYMPGLGRIGGSYDEGRRNAASWFDLATLKTYDATAPGFRASALR
jgi:hypothetical protein